jgi:hypothetical protein
MNGHVSFDNRVLVSFCVPTLVTEVTISCKRVKSLSKWENLFSSNKNFELMYYIHGGCNKQVLNH